MDMQASLRRPPLNIRHRASTVNPPSHLVRSASTSARSSGVTSGRWPNHNSNPRTAWCSSMPSPSAVLSAVRPRRREQRRFQRHVDEIGDDGMPTTAGRCRVRAPAGRACRARWCSPAIRRAAGLAGSLPTQSDARGRRIVAPAPVRAPTVRFATCTRLMPRSTSPNTTARDAPPAPSTSASSTASQPVALASRLLMKPSMSVLVERSSPPRTTACWRRRPRARARRATVSASARSLCGIVTLAPTKPWADRCSTNSAKPSGGTASML